MRLIAGLAVASLARTATAACDDVADTGFATLNGGTTGGAGGTEVTVTTIDQLVEYAAAEGPHVIKVEGTIAVEPWGLEVEVSNDKTIVGVGADATIDGGGFKLMNVNNVIIRNLRIGNTATDDDGGDRDGVQSDTSSNIWIDHCIFEDNGDGSVDLRKDSTFYTVSNNIFRGQDKAFGIGWTENVVAEGTIHHNWFDGTNQRNPSADNLLHAHLFNNYLSGVTSYGHYVRGGTNARIENVYFEGTRNSITIDEGGTLTAIGNVFDGSDDGAADQGTSFDPAEFYDYTLDAAEEVPSIVQGSAGPQADVC